RVELQPELFSVSLTHGTLVPPEGGSLEMGGTSFTIPDTTADPQPAVVDLRARGPVPAMLSLLGEPGLNLLAPTGLTPDAITGEAELAGGFSYPLTSPLTSGDFDLALSAALSDVEST